MSLFQLAIQLNAKLKQPKLLNQLKRIETLIKKISRTRVRNLWLNQFHFVHHLNARPRVLLLLNLTIQSTVHLHKQHLFQLATPLNARQSQLLMEEMMASTETISFQTSVQITISSTHGNMRNMPRATVLQETVDNHGLLLKYNSILKKVMNQFQLATPLNASQSQLLIQVMMVLTETTSCQTSVQIMISLTHGNTRNMPRATALQETVDNHGLLLKCNSILKKVMNPFQPATPLNARPSQLLMVEMMELTETTLFQTSVQITISSTHGSITTSLRATVLQETADNHGLLLKCNLMKAINLSQHATQLSARPRLLLMQSFRRIPIHGIKTTPSPTSVLIMTSSTLTAMLPTPKPTAKMETVDNHGLLLLRKHQSQPATQLNAKPRLLLTPSSRKIPIHGTKTTSFQTSVLTTISLELMPVLQLQELTARPETADNHGLLQLRKNQSQLATPLNARPSQLLTVVMMESTETTLFQTSVLIMISSQHTRMLQQPNNTVQLETLDVDNLGMSLLRKHQSQPVTPLNAKPRLLLTPNSRKIPIHGTKTTLFQISVLITTSLTLTAMLPTPKPTAKMETVDNHGLLLLKSNQSQLATPLNAKQSQLLMEEMMVSKETTLFQTSVLIMILSQHIKMLQQPGNTAPLETLDAVNHGMLLLRKHQSQHSILMKVAKLEQLLQRLPLHYGLYITNQKKV